MVSDHTSQTTTDIEAKGYGHQPQCFDYDDAQSNRIIAFPPCAIWPSSATDTKMAIPEHNSGRASHRDAALTAPTHRPSTRTTSPARAHVYRDWKAILDSVDFNDDLAQTPASTHALVIEAIETLVNGTEMMERAMLILKGRPLDPDDASRCSMETNDDCDENDAAA